jgi:hypothetical protein
MTQEREMNQKFGKHIGTVTVSNKKVKKTQLRKPVPQSLEFP